MDRTSQNNDIQESQRPKLISISAEFYQQLIEENAQLKAENYYLKNTVIVGLEDRIQTLETELDWFKEQVKLLTEQKFGKSSDTIEPDSSEASDDDDALGNDNDEEATEGEEFIEVNGHKRRSKKTKGRLLDFSKLPCERKLYELPEAEQVCACGCTLVRIGEDISKQLEITAPSYYVIEHIRAKYSCRECEQVRMADKQPGPIQKCLAGTSVLADVIVKKYQHHLPLYRQSKIMEQSGVTVPDNTLGNWVMKSGLVLQPLSDAFWEQLNKIHCCQVDETTVKILKPEKKGYMWCYHSLEKNNRFVVFEFSLGRGQETPNQRLKEFKGYLQTDGYSGYNHFRNQREDVICFGCWDHARRKFTDAAKISGKSRNGKLHGTIKLIGKLYKVEATARKEKMTPEERKTLRQKESKPVLAQLHEKLLELKKTVPEKSKFGMAVAYTLNQWNDLERYVDYGEVEISNVLAENQIRPFALGRKNWLFVGTERSAKISAFLYSMIQSCIINKIDPRKYLIYVLRRVHEMRRQEINPESLLPQYIDKKLLE